jgi:hypothetical protein
MKGEVRRGEENAGEREIKEITDLQTEQRRQRRKRRLAERVAWHRPLSGRCPDGRAIGRGK